MPGPVYFDSEGLYIASCTNIRAKIAAIDAIIDALLVTAADAATKDNIEEYSLNDGQTIIRTLYRGTDGIYKSIASFEKLKIYYQSKTTGRMVRLVDGKNFRRYGR